MRGVWLTLLLSAGSCFAQAPAVCPWLSTGTAAAILGGPVELDLHVETNGLGMCRFVSGSGTTESSIEILIGTVDTHACPGSSTKVLGIGNEAVECKSANPGSPALDVIAGRVRDVHFVVNVRNLSEGSDSKPAEGRGEHDRAPAVERIAEQVADNLY